MSAARRSHQNWSTTAVSRWRRGMGVYGAKRARRHAMADGRGIRIGLVSGRKVNPARRNPALASRTSSELQGLPKPAATCRLRTAANIGFSVAATTVLRRHW